LEICSRFKRQYDEKTLSNVSVYMWSSTFLKGRETVENDPHEHWQKISITGENGDRVNALTLENRRITVHELSGILTISYGSVKTIIKHVQYLKVCVRTAVHGCKWRNHGCRSTSRKGTFFGFYHDNGRYMGALLHAQEQIFLNAVASPRVYETQKSGKHVLCWEGYGHHLLGLYKGVLYVDFLIQHHTINAEYHLALLEDPVKTAIRSSRKRTHSVISPG
jgi:hypothetical protein